MKPAYTAGMFTKTQSATLLGLKPVRVEVEVNGGRGVPGLVIVGLPSKAVNEAKERVTTSVQNLGVRIKSLKTIVNLAPADLRKDSSHLEFAMAVGLLQLYKLIPPVTDTQLFLGELSLNGNLKPIRGALPLVLAAGELGFTEIFLPTGNQDEVPTLTGCQVFAVPHLQAFWDHARGHQVLLPLKPILRRGTPATSNTALFPDIKGQTLAKRALMISAAGGHHLLLVGPPGTGKTALAESMPQLLPELSDVDEQEVKSLYSVAGMSRQADHIPPFRAINSQISSLGLMGGGTSLRPGEITLAHKGILFLDEIPEFKRPLLEKLRGPLETGQIAIPSRWGPQLFPARFTLLATANPCACGYLGSHQKVCRCSLHQQQLYYQRLSGPIRDRIELQVAVSDIDYSQWNTEIQTSEFSLSQITTARQQQLQRYQHLDSSWLNGYVPDMNFKNLVSISSSAEKLLVQAAQKFQLSGRGYSKTLRVAQTIADIEAAPQIHDHHIAEALQFRLETKPS